MKSSQLTSVSLVILSGVVSTVISDDIGSVQLLYQNDLTTNTTSTSALLLQSKRSYNDAATSCAALSESLLTMVPLDVQEQLSYLNYSGQLEDNAQFYIASERANWLTWRRTGWAQNCSAYSLAEKMVLSVDCGTELPALCTQSAPPYNSSQLGAPISDSRRLTVKIEDLAITGFRDARSFRFLAIPFAQAPVGALRFAAPLPYNGSTSITALQAGKACIQAPSAYGVYSKNQTSEDCLTLNIFTPTIPHGDTYATMKKPVMVYFYGGSFVEGWSDLADYDGGNLASRGDVVLVTVNYRVGALGFLATATELHGNQAIQDQILALQWIQQHITAFGGDAARVMIFGQSAGAQSVVALLSSSAAKGLFAAAVSESSLLGVIPVTRRVYSKFITPALGNATNCTSHAESDMIACLRALPAERFVDPKVTNIVTQAAVVGFKEFDGIAEGFAGSEPYLPITATSGGVPGIIDDQFQYLIRNGSLPNRVPFMVGTTRNEGGLFVPLIPGFANPVPPTEAEYLGFLNSGQLTSNRTTNAIVSSGMFRLNMSDPDGIRDVIGDILTSYAWQCPWQQVFSTASEKQIFPGLYTYVFDKGVPQAATSPPRCFPDSSLGQQICHTSDIAEVFGRANIVGNPYNTTNSLEFTQYVMDTWISFARTHDPQPSPEYLRACGSAYQSTLQISLEAPFLAYASTADGSIHHFDLPPSNQGPSYPGRCQVYESSGGYTVDGINNAL